MTVNMGLIYLASTFNVLAAFTRGAEPSSIETVPDTFVGSGLRVRLPWDQSDPAFPTLGFVVDAAHLTFAEFAANPAVVVNSRNYYIDATGKPAPYTLAAFGTPAQTAGKFAFSIPKVTPPVASSAYLLLVQSWTGGSTQPVPGTLIAGNVTPVDLSSSYPTGSGNFHVLICIGGYAPTVVEISV